MRILVVDDDDLVQKTMQFTFSDNDVTTIDSGEEALKLIETHSFNVLFLDIRLKGRLTGVDVLKKARITDPLLPIIMMSGLDDDEIQQLCLELGAVDYLVKGTLDTPAYRHKLNNAAVWRKKEAEARANAPEIDISIRDSLMNYRGPSKLNDELQKTIDRVGKTDGPVLIIGESGTGKEIVAHDIWAAKGDENRPFIKVNCGAIQASLIEAELFGYEKGAFTGATERRTGLFEAANSGDILLDEIGELALDFQAKLLRVLQEKRVRRVGSSHEKELDFRVIAATNRNLQAEVAKKTFREDLFYRLDVHTIFLPPLRERRDDIESLTSHFFEVEGLRNIEISQELLAEIKNFNWPGNVRQLMSFVKFVAPMIDPVKSVLTAALWNTWLQKKDKFAMVGGGCADGLPTGFGDLSLEAIKKIIKGRLKNGNFNFDEASEFRRRAYIDAALELSDQNQAAAARLLGISKQRLQTWLRE